MVRFRTESGGRYCRNVAALAAIWIDCRPGESRFLTCYGRPRRIFLPSSNSIEGGFHMQSKFVALLAGAALSLRSCECCLGGRHGRQGQAGPAAAPVVMYNWSGCYVGVNGGWRMGSSRQELRFAKVGGIAIIANERFRSRCDRRRLRRWRQIGYRLASFGGRWVFGLDRACTTTADINSTHAEPTAFPGVSATSSASTPSASSPARSATPGTTPCSTSRAAPR